MARETSLWDWLSKARKLLGDALHIQRIENCIAAGTPDVEGFLRLIGARGQFWLELKSSERPAKLATPIRFKLRDREAQIDWLIRRWNIGANAFYLLQVGSGSDRRLFLAPGNIGYELQKGMTEAELALACLDTGIFSRRFSEQISQTDILKRVITCRSRPSLMVPSLSGS